MKTVIIFLICILAPAAVMALCRRVKLAEKIGPVLILYILGIIMGNVCHFDGMARVQTLLSNAMVPLAIPLMLFSCKITPSETRNQLMALITGMTAVVIAVVAGFFIFRDRIAEAAKVGSMLTGVYTGGTINMAALKTMLGVQDDTFIILNAYDMIISFLYLTFLMGIGVKLFRTFLPCETYTRESAAVTTDPQTEAQKFLSKAGLKDAAVLIGIDAVIIGVAAGLGLLAGDNWFMTVLILTLTTLGIAGSYNKRISKLKHSYDIGMYFIYIFSIVVASMADFSKFDLSAGLSLLGYLTLVVFGSLFIQVILAKLFRIDSDTMVISSVSYICSPPFVPMMAASMKNKRILPAGLAIGVVGYAAGNYLGFLIFRILELF